MRRLWWKLSLGLTLGLAGTGAWADELQWRGNAPVQTSNAAPKVVLKAPRVMLGQPVPADIQRVNREEPTWAAPHGDRKVVRAQGGDIPNPLPKTNDLGAAPLPLPRPLTPPQISEGANGAPRAMPQPMTPNVIAQQVPNVPHIGQPHPYMQPGQPAPIAAVPGAIPSAPIYSTGPTSGPCAVGSAIEAPLISNGQVYAPGGEMYPFDAGHPFGGVFSPLFAGDRWYMDADYLMWWTKGVTYPVLLTTGSPASPTGGNIGDPTTQVLIGGNDVLGSRRDGARFRLGYWFDDCHDCGIEATYFFLGEARDSQAFSSSTTGSPLLARPFFNVNNGVEDAELVAFPGQFAGTAVIEASTNFWGGDISLRKRLAGNCGFRCDGIAGFRFLNLSDNLVATEYINGLPGGVVPGASIIVTDSFRTSNEFYGGQFGFNSRWTSGRWSLDLRTSIALGSTYSTVEINGGQQVLAGQPPLRPGTNLGGLLAVDSNIGRYSKEAFAVVPEVGLNVGWQATEHVRLIAGYNFLYWSNVMRAADQIDRGLDVNRVPNLRLNAPPAPMVYAPRPAPLLRSTDFWAQGINLGLHITW